MLYVSLTLDVACSAYNSGIHHILSSVLLGFHLDKIYPKLHAKATEFSDKKLKMHREIYSVSKIILFTIEGLISKTALSGNDQMFIFIFQVSVQIKSDIFSSEHTNRCYSCK